MNETLFHSPTAVLPPARRVKFMDLVAMSRLNVGHGKWLSVVLVTGTFTIQTSMHAYIHTYICMYAYVNSCKPSNTHICRCVNMCTVYLCNDKCVYVYASTYMHDMTTHIHTCSELSLRILWWNASYVQKNTPITPDRNGSVKRPEKN